jgi:3-oxoacyl-[acyl-carrier-protein] synthase II
MNRMTIAGSRDEAIVVTGMGVVSAAGDSLATFWGSVAGGSSTATWFTDPNVADSPSIPACAVPGVPEDARVLRRSHKMDRCVQLALAAASRALSDAQLPAQARNPIRLGIIVGTSRGPMQKWTEILDLLGRGTRQLPPTMAVNSTLGCLIGALAMAFEARGPCLTVSATCASGAFAIAQAAQQILLGTADVMLAGATEAPLLDAVVRQVLSTGILGSDADPRRACRPFNADRNGTLLGEGAAFLVLESLASARRRKARIHACLAGWAIGTDPCHNTAPSEHGEGLYQVMTRALTVAGLEAGQIDYVNAHGTGTRINDPLEVLALSRLLGDRLGRVPCSSTKPITGHCLGASAALEAVISVLALQHQCVPPTANCTDLDPECPIDAVPLTARPARLSAAMSNSIGFWGYNASLIFTRLPAT